MKIADPREYAIGILEGDRVIAENSVILMVTDGDYGYVRYLWADMPRDLFRCRLDKFRTLETLGFKARVRGRNFAIIPHTVTAKNIPGNLYILCHKDLSSLAADLFMNPWKPQRYAKLNTVFRAKDDILVKQGWDKKLITAILTQWLQGKELVVTLDDLESAAKASMIEARYSKETNAIHMRVVDVRDRKCNQDQAQDAAIFRCIHRGRGRIS